MQSITLGDAKARVQVRLVDGRRGVLTFVHRLSRKCHVRLAGGVYVTVPAEGLVRVEDED